MKRLGLRRVDVKKFLSCVLVQAPGAVIKDGINIRVGAGDGHDCCFDGWTGRGDKYLLLRSEGRWSVEHTSFVKFVEEEATVVLEVEFRACC